MPPVLFAVLHFPGQLRRSNLYRLLVVLLCLPILTLAAGADEVRHTLSFPGDREQIILVRSEFPVTAPVTELIMPNWTPGSYLIRDYAADVNRISARTGDGVDLQIQKTSKDRWQVDTRHTDKLVVQYEVFTAELSVQNSWASKAFSLINGASVFLYTGETSDHPQLLKITSDESRGDVFTAMPQAPEGGGYRADNYDELVDNPVAVAMAPSYRFEVGNQEYVLLNVGENEFWDGQQAARDVEKIVSQTQSFWQANPLERPYWFLNFIVGAKGGLEHDHSTVLMTGRWQIRNRKGYIKWLGLVAHEFFHVWNVRKMRPAELVPYDYQEEQYTRQLWLAEGLSSYYDNLLLSRAGLVNPNEYLELLADDIYRLETTPGRHLQAVTEASFDTWIRHYRPNANTLNSTISYYTKGALIGFVLDTYLRKESRGRHNLDEVMRKMYALYSGKPYNNDAFQRVVADVGGPEAGEFIRSLLNSTSELDVDAALTWYGLELFRSPETIIGVVNAPPMKSGFGVVWDKDKPGLIVKTVLSGSAGAIAGLIPQDEVLAIGNERLSVDNQAALMDSYRPGEETTLLVSRRGRITRLDITLDTALVDKFDIRLRAGYKPSHIKRLQKLLGQNIPKTR
jgi:predicted metalloprotease with PDZ domain